MIGIKMILNYIKKFFKADNRGFTIVEIVVTIFIFSIMVVLVTSIFARAIALERRIVAAQRVQENATFLMESMAKEIRVSAIVNQDATTCTATTLTLNHPVYGTIIYSLDISGNIQRQATLTEIVSSSDVQFTRMRFCIFGSSPIDQMTPRVTIIFSLKNRVGSANIVADLQTTVVSRDITSELQN